MLFNNRSITMNLKQYFTINYWLNRFVLVINVDHILRCSEEHQPGGILFHMQPYGYPFAAVHPGNIQRGRAPRGRAGSATTPFYKFYKVKQICTAKSS